MAYGVDIHPYYQRGYGFDGPVPTFAWVKCSDGSRPYRGVYEGVPWSPDVLVGRAHRAGTPVGGYHYAQPVSRAGVSFSAQTDVLLDEIERVGATGVVPALDIEDDVKQHVWSADEARNFIAAYVARCRARGYRPGIYMNDAMAAKVGRSFLDGLGDVVLWIARYGALPRNTRYDVHQYSSTNPDLDKNESYNSQHLRVRLDGTDDEDLDMASEETLDQIFEKVWYQASSTIDGVQYNAATMLEATFKLLPELVEHVTNDPGVTADAVRGWITDAVKEKLKVTGSIVVGESLETDAPETAEPEAEPTK